MFVLNVMLFEMRVERNSCARNITLDWIGLEPTTLYYIVYLDLAKAFDKVPHQRLLNKLRAYGIHLSLIHI